MKSIHAHKPAEGIIKEAEQCGASVIVVGSRGKGKIRRTFLGSTSDYVLKHAHVPVIVARHKDHHQHHHFHMPHLPHVHLPHVHLPFRKHRNSGSEKHDSDSENHTEEHVTSGGEKSEDDKPMECESRKDISEVTGGVQDMHMQ